MKAKINNDVLEVKIINDNYNENAKEVEILEGTFKGKYTIVENNDFVIEKLAKKNYRYYVQQTIAPDLGENWKTITIKKCETLEDAKRFKHNCVIDNHSNIYSYRILDRLECKYL